MEAKLQHPIGVWVLATPITPDLSKDDLLMAKKFDVLVCDTFNHKIKCISSTKKEAVSWLGANEPGFKDGGSAEARFSEPSGITAGNGYAFIADTNNHAIRYVNIKTGAVKTLEITQEHFQHTTMDDDYIDLMDGQVDIIKCAQTKVCISTYGSHQL